MTRRERVLERAYQKVKSSEHPDAKLAAMILNAAITDAEDELGPPPYKPFDVATKYHVEIGGVPVEDL